MRNKKNNKSEDINTQSIEQKGKNKKKSKKDKGGLMKIQSTQSFLPLRDIRQGIVITRDRKFIKIIEVMPVNFLLKPEDEQIGIIQMFASVIKAMPVKVQFKAISKKADVSGFVTKLRNIMDVEENENCRQLQSEQIELIQSVGARDGVSRRFFIIFEYEQPSGFQKSSEFAEIKASLDTTAARITSMLLRCGNEVIPLTTDDDILNIFYNIICRKESESISYEVRMYETLSRYLAAEDYDADKDAYVPINEFIAPKYIDTKESFKYIVIDGLYYAFAYIPSKAYSVTSVGGWMSLLVNMGEGIDVDMFIKKEDVAHVQQKLTYALRFNKVKAHNMDDSSSEYDDLRKDIESGYYIKNMLANGDEFWYMGILLTVTANSEKDLMWKMGEIKTYLISQGLTMKPCYFMQEEAFMMSLPLCQYNETIFKKSRRNILTSSLASAYPFVAFEVNDENGILFGINKSNNSLVFVDNFDTKKYTNANMAIIGTSGAGKTYTLECMALRMREHKTQVFIIAPEKGHEFKRASDAIGGQYIKISAGSPQNVNVMEIRKKNTIISDILDGEDTSSILAQKIQQLLIFFSLLIPDITSEEKQLLDEAIVQTYKRFGITDDNASLISEEDPTKYKTMPILGDLYEQLVTDGLEQTNRMRNIMNRYVSGSAKSFNGQTNVNLDNEYIIFDVTSLTPELQPIGMFIVLDYIWDKVKEDRTARKAIFLDELWLLIGATSSEQAAEFVLKIFKTIRAYGGSAIAATQDLNDFMAKEDGKYGKGIINNAQIKLIMKLLPKEAYSVQDSLDLSDMEVQSIARFEKGEGLLVASSNHVVINFRASQGEHELVTTDPQEVRRIAERKLREQEMANEANFSNVY